MERSDQIGQAFRDVDRADQPEALVNFLSLASSLDQVAAWERQIVDLLRPRLGDWILDVGCGLGDDVRALAEIVGPSGRAVGIDHSLIMIEAARERSVGSALSVEFHQGDAHNLEFPNDTFDGCRTERTLQHLANPRQAIQEMIRVAKPGARIVALEADWDTMIVNAEDRQATRRIVQAKTDGVIRNGWIGRQLPGLFHLAGLIEVGVIPIALTFTDLATARKILDWDEPARLAQQEGQITPLEVERWFGELRQAEEQERFFAAVFGFIVAGRKPAVR